MKADNCTGTVNVQGDASGRSKLIVQTLYFLAFESETGCLFSSLILKQGAKFVRSLRARVPIHSTVWHLPVGFNLFVFCPGN